MQGEMRQRAHLCGTQGVSSIWEILNVIAYLLQKQMGKLVWGHLRNQKLLIVFQADIKVINN